MDQKPPMPLPVGDLGSHLGPIQVNNPNSIISLASAIFGGLTVATTHTQTHTHTDHTMSRHLKQNTMHAANTDDAD